jgi:oxalate decarboxylase/phosphoglucose isomerase-like protein (cupin superfamily)
VSIDLTKQAAYSDQTPYELWQTEEGIPIYTGLGIDDLRTVELGAWPRKGAAGAFINMLGAGRSCDAYVCEIAAKCQTLPERYLFEELIYVVNGRGATTVWQDGGRKQTFEWHEGSMFSPPLNTWRQHFNAQGDQPARFVALTDAPVIINRFRNLDFVLNNRFVFSDRFSGEDGYFSGKGQEVTSHRTWDSNFIANIPGFRLLEHSARGQGARGILLHFSANTMSAHIEEYPVGTYPRAHWHGPGAHILILSGEGYSFMWEQGKKRERIDWKPGSLFVPPAKWFHQHFNPGREPARYLALKPWGFTYQVEDLVKTLEVEATGGTQIDYQNQDPEIHETFVKECAKRGVEVRLKF